MSGQQTVSSQDDHLSGQTFGLPVILIDMQVSDQKKRTHFQTIGGQASVHFMCLLFRLVRSSYYSVIFNILNQHKRYNYQAKISLDSRHDWQQSQIYFEHWLQNFRI